MGSGSVKQYTYDENNRLKRCITDLNYITDYWYDEYNNITVTRTLSGGAAYLVYYEYDENNRLISSNDGHTTTVYEYDCNGNMVKSSGEETTDYIFNGAGELAEVWQEGEIYTYEYDHTGLRTAKTVDGVTTQLVNDGMYVVAEYVGANSTYYYRSMNLIGYVSDDEIGYYRFNAHGDVVAVTDVAGKVITEYNYDPFGKLEDDENEWLKILFGIYVEDNNPFRYCAEYYDTETEFIYLRARYYSPDLQRFISEDPIRFAKNWYAYCGNMPIVYMDVSGLYYIKESYTVEYDMFGHPRRVSTGVYTLCPETWWSYTGKAIVSFLPFGTGITWLFESSENVVGGNSSTSFNDVVTDSVTELAVELTTAALKEISESISGIIGVASTLLQIVDVIKKLDMVQMDAIAFDLLTRNNISLSSTSQEELEQLMEKTYEFILVNGDYFALKIDGNRTLYEIDQKISKAWFKDWCIDSLVQDVKNDINDLVYNGGQYDLAQEREEILSAYRELYGDYSNRIEYVDEVFLKYIST